MTFEIALSDPYAQQSEFSADARLLDRSVAFNGDPYKENLIVHPFSRAGNRDVQIKTLYQLKSGPRAKRFLGANVVNYGDIGGTAQTYIASEAPYHADDYFRMIADTGAKTLVSLTGDNDQYKPRKRFPVDVHHLKPGDKLHIDGKGMLTQKGGMDVVCTGEVQFKSSYPDTSPILIKKYVVTKPGGHPYEVQHIIYKGWKDHGAPAKPNDALALIEAVNKSQSQLGESPVAVNCGYGQGRTNALILMHQLERLMNRDIAAMIPDGTEKDTHLMALTILQESLQENPKAIDIDSFIAATHARVMPLESAQPDMLRQFPQLYLQSEIGKLSEQAKAAEPPLHKSHSHVAQVRLKPSDKSPLR